ncbi:unnamed protein product [Rotaria socialis]|uniref:Uncharacterized protein n=1 Tax=Rotaria socialis TaxID=392032 RepID=A0A821B5S6_9BILA|nr:unnamed protein product [Rotaria socialis]CAF4502094.1 unnamed protein product [Rotaria socialis]CAF4586119.1 unnamed protein product [Rotaria socialis]CAF4636181.1 unnamed protein product [Rotaria socialis]CAF4650349.1 unnamed protein product [Rotaria socialis]
MEIKEPLKKRNRNVELKKGSFDNAGEAVAPIENQWLQDLPIAHKFLAPEAQETDAHWQDGFSRALSIYLLYHADRDRVTVHETEAEYTHHDDAFRGVDEVVKN